ncbi:LuxR C-terminal-related transcriptional regulator [Desulfobacula sp.]|nr:response regulator transcription factor [Desulfobacula sp.]
MFISIRTVKAHLTSIFKKTGCHNRLELATRMK